MDGSGEVTFKVPGGLEGVLRIDAKWGGPQRVKNSKITITGGELNASKTDALPNETITITGNGFGSQTCIPAANITWTTCRSWWTMNPYPPPAELQRLVGVEVSNSGQFVATVILWPGRLAAHQPDADPRHPRAER